MTDRVEEIRGRLEGATPGQWKIDGLIYSVSGDIIGGGPDYDGAYFNRDEDRVLAENAPADIRYLLDEVDRLRLEVGKMRDAVDMTRAVR